MSLIKRHPVVAFFLLAYALSWAAIPWQSFFAPGVLVAALIIVSLTEGLTGLKAMGARLIRWRPGWWRICGSLFTRVIGGVRPGVNAQTGQPSPTSSAAAKGL